MVGNDEECVTEELHKLIFIFTFNELHGFILIQCDDNWYV